MVSPELRDIIYNYDTTGRNQQQIDDLAMRIMYDFAQREEYAQGQSWSGSGRWTSAAFEDIVSDIVGTLVGEEMAKNSKLTFAQAELSVLKKCFPVTKTEAQKVFDDNKETCENATNWSAKPTEMKCDPCATKKVPPYTAFSAFEDEKKFQRKAPTSVQPPEGKVWK